MRPLPRSICSFCCFSVSDSPFMAAWRAASASREKGVLTTTSSPPGSRSCHSSAKSSCVIEAMPASVASRIAASVRSPTRAGAGLGRPQSRSATRESAAPARRRVRPGRARAPRAAGLGS